METIEEIDFILNEIAKASNLKELDALLQLICEQLGVANIAYHALRIPKADIQNPLSLVTFEPAWVARYKENNYFNVDPVFLFGRRAFLPFDWSEVDRDSRSAKRFFEESKRFDVGLHGLTIPVHGPCGEKALFTVTSNMPERQWKDNLLCYMRNFQLVSHFFHDRAVSLGGFRLAMPSKLSRRERECLQAITRGKATKQIASELALSASAIQLYLRSARRKLSAKSLTEAAIFFSHMDDI